jgi:hypothetical protein
MLDRVRVAMSEELTVARGTEVSRSGLNLGIGLMYVGLWPSLLAVIASPSGIPLAFLMLTVVLVAIIFGSGPILRSFQTDEIHPEVERARRKEIAFGSTLMYLASIIATLFVAVGVPDSWVRIMLVAAISAVFGILLAASKVLYSAYRDLASNEPVMLKQQSATRELATSTLDPIAADLKMPSRDSSLRTGELTPASVTEGTTRLLDEKER